jgi:hypothetical protein
MCRSLLILVAILFTPLANAFDYNNSLEQANEERVLQTSLDAADLNYQQDHDNKIIQDQADQIRDLQNKLEGQNESND